MLARWRARTPLRRQLVLVAVLLAGLAVVVTGLVGAALLRQNLLDRVDAQLVQVSDRLPRELNRAGLPDLGDNTDTSGPGAGQDRPWLGPSGPAETYLVQIYDLDGQLLADVGGELDDTSDAPRLPDLTADAATDLDGAPFTATSGAGQWRVLVTTFSDATLLVATPLAGVNRTVGQLLAIDAAVGAVLLALLAGVALWIVRASLRPLREVERTAEAVAAGDLSRRVPVTHPGTEVGSLGTSLNTMMTRIEQAFAAQADSEAQARGSEERMRRFVGDASHELRTPLTSVRGFAELYRQGAVGTPDLPRVMRRIEDEAARMGLLVEDLLLLARLDQQRPLTLSSVDLVALAADAVHDAPATGPQHPTTLRVLDGPAPVVLGDEARLRQVLANLMANAVTHTPPGTPVRVTVGVTHDATDPGPAADSPDHTRDAGAGRGWALLEVADDGPGMAPDDAARAFERFYRSDASRTRAHGAAGEEAPAPTTHGSGLGLSIVAAIVAAHGGHVDVSTAEGTGATFRVQLPLQPLPVAPPADAQAPVPDVPGTAAPPGTASSTVPATHSVSGR